MYNLKTNTFVSDLPNINETDFLRIQTCEHTGKQTITLFIFGEEPTCLHNEDEQSEKIAIELFINQNEEFKNNLDFFTNN